MNVQELLSQMTLEEKVLLLTGAGGMETYEIERLQVPVKHFADGPHGVRTHPGDDCTMFPNLCCAGATWNRDLMFRMGQAIADDCIAHNVDTILGPGANLKRTPLCGRNFEYMSEDPVATGEMAAAYINGVQSRGVGTCLKHYALNNQETYRLETSVEVDIRVMQELYLKGFEIAVKKSQPYSIMCSYNKVHSVWAAENKYLLSDVLKDDWGYEGCVVSDWGAVRDICLSVAAGLDLQMPKNGKILDQIHQGLEKGTVTEADIDKAAATVLRFVLRPKPQAVEAYDREKQHQIARDVAAEGIVLLKNKNNALPLTSEKYKKIAVIGEFAENPLLFGQGSAEVYAAPEHVDSPLEELRKRLSPETEVVYQQVYSRRSYPDQMIWPNAAQWREFIKDADAVVFFLGCMESEDTEQFDRRSIEFNPNYNFVVEMCARTHTNIIAVIQSGSAMALGSWHHKANGILQMWLGGEGAGSAIADVLTGAVNPSGRLTETFPTAMRRDLEYPGDGLKVCYNEGFDVGYRYYDKHPDEVLYPFGHGLSYSTFGYEDISVTKGQDTVDVKLKLKNLSDIAGADVIQVYVSKKESCVTRPVKELKAFEKVFVEAGSEVEVTVPVAISDLAYYNVMLNKWIVEPGVYHIHVATSAQNIIHTGRVMIDGNAPYTIKSFNEAMVG